MVARQADHALHQELRSVYGKIENYNVSAFDRAVGQQMDGAWPSRKMQFVHQQEVSHQQRVFHGAGGDLERLHHKRNHEDAEDHNSEECLDSKQVASRGNISCWSWRLRRRVYGRRRFRACLLRDGVSLHGISRRSLCSQSLFFPDLIVIVHSFSACPRRCSSACLAASCSAFFFVPPSARATYSGLLCPWI